MMTQSIETREGLPQELTTLLRDYPRDSWPDHPNFAASIAKWMAAHATFRALGEVIVEDTKRFLDKEMEQDLYLRRIGRHGNALVHSLHGHHTWEDRKFFPELEAADRRFAAGLEMLEGDHIGLDGVLDGFTRAGNRMIQLEVLDPSQLPNEAGRVLEKGRTIRRFLDRHLTDEEDLVVPILLHHRLRG